MTKSIKDDWHKPRGKGQHLTPADIAQIKAAFDAKRKPRDVARELQCSTRVAEKYFRQFGMGDAPVVVKRFRPDRLYTSNFEL